VPSSEIRPPVSGAWGLVADLSHFSCFRFAGRGCSIVESGDAVDGQSADNEGNGDGEADSDWRAYQSNMRYH